MITPPDLDLLLTGLNPPQREAVTTTDGVLMVLAGAGSGKTRVLTRRLAYLLAMGVAHPGEILAVTFTNKASREMRHRVVELLNAGPDSLQKMWIGTFHGMSARILRIYGHLLGYESNFTILDTGDQERLLKRLLEEDGQGGAFWTPSRMASTISRWKDDGLGPDDLDAVEFRVAQERQWISAFYTQYQQELQRTNCMDFGDLLYNCLILWRLEPATLERFRDQFRYLLVDEFQDTNKVQYQWLQSLAAGHGNLCVVGDEDQSIYSWRGARMDNILRFSEDYPASRVIRLEQNYRSTANILAAASQLIQHNTDRLGKTLWTADSAGSPLELHEAEDGEEEAEFVAREIARNVAVDGDAGRCAILVRASRQTRLLEEALRAANLPYRVVGGLRFMDRAEVKDAVAYLRLVRSDRDELAFDRVINVPKRGIGPVTLQKIYQTASQEGIPLLEAVRFMIRNKVFSGVVGVQLAQFVAQIDHARAQLGHAKLDWILERLLADTGYLDHLDQDPRGEDRRENLDELRNDLSRFAELDQFLEQAILETDRERGGGDGDMALRSVTISTLHAAKGLEFPVVFLVGLEEGLLPHAMALKEGGRSALEEERRLVYVGITRAREKLYLSYARRRQMANSYQPTLPSRFLQELPEEGVVRRRGGGMTIRAGWRGQKKRFFM